MRSKEQKTDKTIQIVQTVFLGLIFIVELIEFILC